MTPNATIRMAALIKIKQGKPLTLRQAKALAEHQVALEARLQETDSPWDEQQIEDAKLTNATARMAALIRAKRGKLLRERNSR